MATRTHGGERVVLVERGRRFATLRAGIVAAMLVWLGLVVVNGLPSLGDLFGSKTVDRSPPPVLKSIDELSEYHAATANRRPRSTSTTRSPACVLVAMRGEDRGSADTFGMDPYPNA